MASVVTLQDHMEGKPDRRLLLFSAILLIVGVVVSAVAQQFHEGRGVTATDVFTAYANSTNWTLVHEAQFAGSSILIFGILALFLALNVNSGIRGVVNRFAAASAVAALALNGVLYAVDGVALKQAVDAWVSAPASEQSTFFAVAQGIRGLEWGIRSYVDFATGLSLILFAIVIVSSARIPRPIGYIMGLTGLLHIAGGYIFGAGYTSLTPYPTPASADYWLLIVVWAVWLLISAYRMKSSKQRTSPGRQDLNFIKDRTYAFETLFSISVGVFCTLNPISTNIRYADTDFLHSNA
jgi:hypothetical protein